MACTSTITPAFVKSLYFLSTVVTLTSLLSLLSAAPTTENNPALAEGTTISSSNNTLFNEELCLKAGGICLQQNECPNGKLSETKGLCPTQQADGVECCYGISKRERRCTARGGLCRRDCRRRELYINNAEDCEEGEICCVLAVL